jgi:hypothetical protein
MSVDRAWRDFTTGDGKTVIAYVEGGINWRHDPEELANQVFLNGGELPPPTTRKRDGALSAEDYGDTDDSNGNDLVDPEDIIVRFSDGSDDDHNGYVDDISGWDFYNDQNDPATVDSQYDHANGQMEQAAAETNNGLKGAGICPKCRLLPIKAGAEALDRTDDLAQAWLYAADVNADVIVSTTADLGYSTFMSEAIDHIWRRGTVMVESSNDFNSTDHQGGMFHQHVLPGNGLVANTAGLGTIPNSAVLRNGLTTTYRARSAYTEWGTHNMFSAATTGGTTSEATPTVGGVMALVLSYGKKAARQGLIDRPLSASEAVQVVRATASDVASNPNPPTGWPAKPGFDLQYGYGRPNVYKAMQAIQDGEVPPEAWINSPPWYSLYDPTETRTVPVRGHVAAKRAKRYRWRLEFAPGPEPLNGEFITAGRGSGRKPFTGRLGTIDLSRVPQSFWSKAFSLSNTKTLETNEHYTVTIRLQVTDNKDRVGEERRAIAVQHDPTWRKGFPVRIGPGGEAQPQLADLRGRGRQAVIFGDSDGRIHALSPRGNELPGFPAHTMRTEVTRSHRGVEPGHEPLFTNPAVGDLDGNGKQWIVATSSTGRTYVWSSRGRLRPGWPRVLNAGVQPPGIPRPDREFTRPTIMGATAPPVLVELDGDKQLEILQSGWDGRIHAWNPSGKKVQGWPVHVTLPPGTEPPDGMVSINDQKLDLPPTLAELDGDPEPELLQRTQYSFAKGAGLQFPLGGVSNVVAYNHDGSRVPGFLLSGDALVFYYGSAQEFITEGVNTPTTADVDGDGLSEIASAAGIFSPTTLYNADASVNTVYGPVPGATLALLQGNPAALLDAFHGDLPDDAPVNFTTSGAFGKVGPGGLLAYAEPGSGGASVAALAFLTGAGIPINSYMRAFNAQTGAPMPGMPAKSQGLDFLGAPVIADVTGDGSPEILEGGDSSALHAFTATGAQAPGFPKFHTGWLLFAPAVGDLNADGHNEVAAATREGYVMVWNTPGRADGNDEWWSVRHDERNTGMYGVDTRPPGAIRKAKLRHRGRELVFTAPGDDWYEGQVDHYRVKIGLRCDDTGGGEAACAPGPPPEDIDATVDAGSKQAIDLPQRADRVRIWAVDEAGNRGRTKRLRRR